MKRRIPIILGIIPCLAVSARAQKWTRFEDPAEKAFSIDVPAGWTAQGGMFRLGYSDVRPMLDLRSPDGKIEIRSGDVAVPSYAFPTPQHGEGSPSDLGAQAQGTYANYREGKVYARLYALAHFRTVCHSLTPQDASPSAPVQEPPAAPPNGGRTSAGAVAYRCDSAAGPRTAYVYARTTSSPPQLWQVVTLVSYLAPPDQEAAVRAILMHASQSFQLNPQWVEYQKKMDAEGLQYQIMRQRQRMMQLSQQVQQFQQRMAAMRDQVNAFERRQAQQAKQVTDFTNILTGITPTVDPLNGQKRDVWTGPHGGYWVNSQGTVINSNLSPGPGFRPLQPEN